jgi:hypothetical protein
VRRTIAVGLAVACAVAGLADAGATTSQTNERGRLRDRLPDAVADAGPTLPRVVEVKGRASVAAVEAAGGTVLGEAPGGVEARLTGEELAEVAAHPGVDAVTPAPELRPHVVSQGVGGIDADDWHLVGTDGTGVDVAVIDLGFAGYQDLVSAGELPPGTSVDLDQCGGATDLTDHGTAVAEIVHDVAPGATIHLICTDTPSDLDAPTDPVYAYLRDNGVEVANASFGTVTNSRMDGGGAIDRAVTQSRRDGTLWTVSSGNLGGQHRSAPAGTRVYREFVDDYYADLVNIGSGSVDTPWVEVLLPPGDGDGTTAEVVLELTWDAWPTTRTDFDLYVSTSSSIADRVAWSALEQRSSPLPPTEDVKLSNPYPYPTTVYALVDSWHSPLYPADPRPTPVRLDLYAHGAISIDPDDAGTSVAEPGTSRGALTVGASCYTSWSGPGAGPVREYSSRGPTIDGRVKPDLTGPDGTAGSTYGTSDGCLGGNFTGTSAAAPHVAGAAALLLQANPSLDPSEAEAILVSRATPSGPAGKDSTGGWGQLEMGPPGEAEAPAGDLFTGTSPPKRLLDTRSPSNPLGSGATRRLKIAGTNGVPADARAVTLNVTAVSPSASAYLTVFPAGAARPTASNLNFSAGTTVANAVTVGLGSDGSIDLFNYAGTTHVLVDIAGWYGPSAGTGLANLAPIRAIDTRAGKAARITPTSGDLGGAEVLTTQVAGNGAMPEVPATATAVVANVTVTTPTRSGHLTVWPAGLPKPTVSNINFRAGQTIANLAVVPVGADGSVSFAGSLGKLHVVVDVLGYYDPGAHGRFVPLPTVVRIGDTRTGNGSQANAGPTGVGSGQVRRFDAAHLFGVPGDATTLTLNVTAVAPTAATGHLSVWGKGGQPSSSTLNFTKGAVVPNATFTSLGAASPSFLPGQAGVVNTSAGVVDVIVDLSGYFIDGSG